MSLQCSCPSYRAAEYLWETVVGPGGERRSLLMVDWIMEARLCWGRQADSRAGLWLEDQRCDVREPEVVLYVCNFFFSAGMLLHPNIKCIIFFKLQSIMRSLRLKACHSIIAKRVHWGQKTKEKIKKHILREININASRNKRYHLYRLHSHAALKHVSRVRLCIIENTFTQIQESHVCS